MQFLAIKAAGGDAMKPYPQVEDLLAPALRVRMPRALRLVASGGTIHVVARCNNRELYFTTADDCDRLLAHLRAWSRNAGRCHLCHRD